MQSLRTLRIAPRLAPSFRALRPNNQVTRRYASDAPPPPPAKKDPGTNLPLIAIGGGVVFFFVYYFAQGSTGGARQGERPPGEGQATIKEARRQGDPSQEYKDPRDSGNKTSALDQKRQEAVKQQKQEAGNASPSEQK